MKLQTGVTKENLFDDMKQRYPNAMNYFTTWIDAYKTAVGWDALFAANTKFHSLPYAMQFGIWMEFMLQIGESCGEDTTQERAEIDLYVVIPEFLAGLNAELCQK